MDQKIFIVSFLNYWITMMLIAWFACIYTDKKMKIISAAIFSLLTGITAITADILLVGNYHLLFLKVIAITVIGAVCMSVFLKTRLLKESLIIMVFMFIILLPIDYVLVRILNKGTNLNLLTTDFDFVFIKRVLLNVYFLVLFTGYRLFKKKYNFTISLLRSNHINLFILLLATLFIVYLNYQLLIDTNKRISILNVAILLIFIGAVLFSTRKIINLNKREQEIIMKDLELENQKLFNKALEAIVDNAREVQHSYDNTLASIKGYLCFGDYNGLEKFVDAMIENNASISTIRAIARSGIKNAGVMGIILRKMEYANDKDVIFKLNVQNELSNMNTSIYEVTKILGILLDNAIEAAKESKEKFVQLDLTKEADIISFSVANAYKNKPDTKEMFKKGFSTKGEERGNGLFYVKEIIKKQEKFILNTLVDDYLVRQDFIVDNSS